MRGQILGKAIAAVLCSFVLAGCGGGSSLGNGTTTGATTGGTTGTTTGGTTGSTSGGTTTGPSATPFYINLSIGTATATSDGTGTNFALTATVTDANHLAVIGSTVAFSSTGGSIAVTNNATNTSGSALAVLTLPNDQPAGTYTITATDGDVANLSSSAALTLQGPSSLALGVISTTGTFTTGKISIGQSPVSAGGKSGIEVMLVDTSNGDQLYTTSSSVTFTSPCIAGGNATITSPVTSSTGTFDTTYTAAGCSGNDVITATANISGSALTASGTITVTPPSLGSIQFTAPTAAVTIGLRGSGLNETQAVQFTVLDGNGNPVPNQTVNFQLSTSVGGLGLSTTSASSNSSGIVQTVVSSGTVHTVVRVIATATKSDGTVLSTQSNQLTVSTGFPAQNGMSISASKLSLVGNDVDGNTSTISAILSDRYNNPVPDGTAVTFTSECGQIQPSCSTVGGGCSVTFTTANPRTSQLAANNTRVYADNNCATNPYGLGCDDHRCTVLATAIGEESFNDCNGTGQYVSKDNSSNNPTQCPNGDFFVSLPEAFLDSNEDGLFEGDFETYLDFNGNKAYDPATNKFVGLLCNDADCDTAKSLNVRQSLVIVMTSSGLVLTPTPTSLTIPVGGAASVKIIVSDSVGQVPPAGTIVAASLTTGTVLNPNSFIVPNRNAFGPIAYSFTVSAPTTAGSDQLVINATTPAGNSGNAGLVTTVIIPVTYK